MQHSKEILGAAILGIRGDEVVHTLLAVDVRQGAPYTVDLAGGAHPPDGFRARADDAPGPEAAGLASRYRTGGGSLALEAHSGSTRPSAQVS